MTIRVKISDGIREVEVEAPSMDGRLKEVEELATRLYREVRSGVGGTTPAGFNGWSTVSDHERQPEE